jgi:putative endonuclease
VVAAKQRALVFAAQHYLQRFATPPPCRFDVVAVDGDRLEWLPAAFDAGGW